MNNLVVLPIVMPVLSGVLMLFFRKRIGVQKWIGMLSLAVSSFISVILIQQVMDQGIQTLHSGGWMPPFGIVLVADMFALLLLLTGQLVSMICLWFSFRSIGAGRERYFFYPLFQFLVAGVSGSFITGDIFNLFVFFEVMLISSYGLLVLGGEKIQLRESLKYLLFNIVSSVFFVASVAFLYGLTGTLNMAHLAQRTAELGQGGLLTVVALLFLFVFGMKAALFLYVWLPGAYSAPPVAVSAIFSALLTKVGIYALFRVFSLIFIHEPGITHTIIGWLAVLTIILGTIGAVAYQDVRKIMVYNLIATVGFVVLALAVFSHTAFEGAVFYLIHDMIVKGLLFLAGGAILIMAGTSELAKMGGLMKHSPQLGWIFFVMALSLAGIPPLSGFMGKLLIVEAGFSSGNASWYVFTALGLLSSLLLLYSLIKVFMSAFWKSADEFAQNEKPKAASMKGLIAPCAALLVLTVAVGIGAEWLYTYVRVAADTLADPAIYIEAVLKE